MTAAGNGANAAVGEAALRGSNKGGKKHRHTKTWAGPGEKSKKDVDAKDPKAKAAQEAAAEAAQGSATHVTRKKEMRAPTSPYLSEEERSVFVKTPGLLNEPSFEPRVIKGATPYVPRTRHKHKSDKSDKDKSDKDKEGKEGKEVAKEATKDGRKSRESTSGDESGGEAAVAAGTVAMAEAREASKIYQGIHRRYNSMQTLHLASVLHSPDVREILHCFARALFGNMKLSESVEQPVFLDVYSELTQPLHEGSRRHMPTVQAIEAFVTRIYTGIALAPENCVMALAYIERLVALTNVTLHPSNWRRIVLAALLLASKVWEDLAVHNRDMLRVFPQMKLRDVLELEHAFLEHLQFTVSLKASVYAKYYFELRTLSELDEHTFPMRPLSEEGAVLLEARSRGAERKVAEQLHEQRHGRRRAKSVSDLASAAAAAIPGANGSTQSTTPIGYDAFIKITHHRAATHAPTPPPPAAAVTTPPTATMASASASASGSTMASSRTPMPPKL